ncbi:hypothetical protein F5890DRAFT_1535679 [Lentinula detonsa]|uniref:Uncharacterized protein n=1 Tax=Lentinula detonsa TaxID=2804962 RepID=A0AA38UQ94_9AGAR|nr:hypothetical protein F5890DRAFT_1535679 [Lentinula detonsa]
MNSIARMSIILAPHFFSGLCSKILIPMSTGARSLPCSPSIPLTGTEDPGECSFIDLATLTRRLEQVQRVPQQLSRYAQVEYNKFCVLNQDSFVASIFPNPHSRQLDPVCSNREIKPISGLAPYILHVPSLWPETTPARLQAGDQTVLPSHDGLSQRILFPHEISRRLLRLGPTPHHIFPHPSTHPVLSRYDEDQELFHTESSRKTSLSYYPSIPPKETRMRRIVDYQKIRCPIPSCTAVISPYIEDVRTHLVCDHCSLYSLRLKTTPSECLHCSCGHWIHGGGEAIALHIACSHVPGWKVECTYCDWEGLRETFERHLPLCSDLRSQMTDLQA